MGQGQVFNQSWTSWYLVITASRYIVAVLIMSLINYITHQCTNATQNTPHQRSPGKGLLPLIALLFFFTSVTEGEGGYVFTPAFLFVCVQDISKSC